MKPTIILQPKQKEALLKSFETPVLFYGGAKGGGKSYLVRARELYRRFKYPNSKGLIVRKTYPELLSNHIRLFFQEYPYIRNWFKKAEKAIYWPNNSITEFSYLSNTDDVYTYQGREYEDISIDEITQHDEQVFKILRSSNRTALKDIQPTMLLTGNPGGIGHQWVKRLFVDRQFRGNENPDDFYFIKAFLQDNKALMKADPNYIKRLEDLPEHLRRAYLFGDWNIHAGSAFNMLSPEVHIIKRFKLPDNTAYFGGYDWGYAHPFAFVLFAVTEDEKVYVVGNCKAVKQTPKEQAEMIKNVIGDKRINIHAGLDIWSRKGGPTIYEQLRNYLSDCVFVKAKIDRIQGANEIRKYIVYENTETNEPKLRFFENTADVFNNLREMQYDIDKDPEDVIKMDANDIGEGGDDYYDAFRYGLMSRAYPNPKQVEVVDPKSGEALLEAIRDSQRKKQALAQFM